MPSFVTNEGAHRLHGALDWTSSGVTIKARLVASSASPNKDDTAMTGFSAIGTDQTLTASNRVIAKDTTNDYALLRYTATITWPSVPTGSTVGWVAIYLEEAAADSSRVPLVWLDVSPDVPTNGGDLSLTAPTVSGTTHVIAYSAQ